MYSICLSIRHIRPWIFKFFLLLHFQFALLAFPLADLEIVRVEKNSEKCVCLLSERLSGQNTQNATSRHTIHSHVFSLRSVMLGEGKTQV